MNFSPRNFHEKLVSLTDINRCKSGSRAIRFVRLIVIECVDRTNKLILYDTWPRRFVYFYFLLLPSIKIWSYEHINRGEREVRPRSQSVDIPSATDRFQLLSVGSRLKL